MSSLQGAAYTQPFVVLDVAAFKADFANVDEVSVTERSDLSPQHVQVIADDGLWPWEYATRDGEPTQSSVPEIIMPHLPVGQRVAVLSVSFQGPASVQADVLVFDRDGNYEEESLFSTALRLQDALEQSARARRQRKAKEVLYSQLDQAVQNPDALAQLSPELREGLSAESEPVVVGSNRSVFTDEEMRKAVATIDLAPVNADREGIPVWALNDTTLTMDYLGHYASVHDAKDWADDNTERWYVHYYTAKQLQALMAQYAT